MKNSELKRIYNLLNMAEYETPDVLKHAISQEQEYIILSLVPVSTSLELLLVLAEDQRTRVKRAVASSIHATSNILDVLLESKDEELVCLVAKHRNATSEQLVRLSRDFNSSTRIAATKNLNIPLERLYELLDDSNPTVRTSAAQALKNHPDSDFYNLPISMKDYGLKFKNIASHVSSFR